MAGGGPAAVDGLGRIAETNTSVQAALGVRLDNPADGAAVGVCPEDTKAAAR